MLSYTEFFEQKERDKDEFKATKIVSAFPGCGKTTFFKDNKDLKLSDSDSTNFSWVINDDGEKVRNPEFPTNYIEHIKSCIGEYDYVFVSSHKEVRDALLENAIFFFLVYPDKEYKKEFIERYEERGNDEAFIKLLKSKWAEWINDIIDAEEIGFKRYEINEELPYLSDVIKKYKI